MTSYEKRRRSGLNEVRGILLSMMLTAAVFMIAIYLSDDLGGYVKDSLMLSARVIIPSIFPFLILTDMITPYLCFEVISPLKKAFEGTFKISGGAIPIFFCGILCGFPIGAKMAYDAYRRGTLSRDECDRLTIFSNNASAGYIISAVGVSIRGSVRDGVILYISMLLSSIAVGWLLGTRKSKSELSDFNIEQKNSFTESVKHAASVSINVCAFISTFGIFVGLTRSVVKNELLSALLIAPLEIGSASLYLANSEVYSPLFSIALTSFAISFSGLSVIFQTLAIRDRTDKTDLKLHVIGKLMQGIISSFITIIIYILLG